jgi:hypothetical protein
MITGSSSIKFWFPDFPRGPKDLDIVVRNKNEEVSVESDLRVEKLENPVLLDYLDEIEYKETYLSPDILYTLKLSHMFWDLNWEKHNWDQIWLQKKGCQINMELFYRLYDYWNEFHGKNKRSDLKMSAEDFFDNALKCEYNHDDLHTILNPIPTYTKVLIGEVEVSQEKFQDLSFEDKCNLVTEEVMIMAFERWPKADYRFAYSKMLKKFIISHAPIWEAIFILQNFVHLHKPKFNYFKTITDGLSKIKQSFGELTIS